MVGSAILAVALASMAVKGAVAAVLEGEILLAVTVFFVLGAPLIFLGCIALAAVYVTWREQNDPDAFFEDQDGMIEFWLSATFAVIVARFVGGSALPRSVLRIMAFSYLVTSLLSVSRYGLAAGRSGVYREQVLSMGLEPSSLPTGGFWAMG